MNGNHYMLVQVVPVLLAAHCLGLLALSLPRHAATLGAGQPSEMISS